MLIRTLLLLSFAATPALAKIDKSELNSFAEELAADSQWSASEARNVLDGARYKQSIIDAISRPAERSKQWHEYRKIFMTARRLEGGIEFWKENAELLASVERDFGVDPAVIVAILGVETRYGGYIGSYRVLDALYTLGFSYPPRAKFFRKELHQFLRLTREENVDLDKAKGSYAGAMGMPQFIPSSYRRYAVDYDADGRRDLWDSVPDIVGSIGNYLSVHGWESGQPVAEMVTVKNNALESQKEKGLKPWTTVGALQGHGVQMPGGLKTHADASLIKLRQANEDEYWVGLKNFYVITRYNHSAMYAMAVWQLAREIRAGINEVDVDNP